MSVQHVVAIVAIAVACIAWLAPLRLEAFFEAHPVAKAVVQQVVPVVALLIAVYAYEDANHSEVLKVIQENGRPGGTFRHFDSYPEFVEIITQDIHRTTHRWLVTRIQSEQAVTVGEQDYFNTMDHKLANGSLSDCRRIVTIPTTDHLRRYQKMIRRWSCTPSFGMAVWHGAPPLGFELLIGDDSVVLAFGSRGPESGIALHNKDVTTDFARLYDQLWSRQANCRILKNTQALLSKKECAAAVDSLQLGFQEH